MPISNGLDLSKTGRQRLMDVANYKTARFMFITDSGQTDRFNLEINAELIDIIEMKANSGYNARALYRIDKNANGVPAGIKNPTKRYYSSGVYIKRITAQELIDKIGIGGIIYLGLSGAPETTTELVGRFNGLYNLDMVEGDIVEQIIPENAKCIAIKFEKLSLNFSGTFRVDLTTPIVEAG